MGKRRWRELAACTHYRYGSIKKIELQFPWEVVKRVAANWLKTGSGRKVGHSERKKFLRRRFNFHSSYESINFHNSPLALAAGSKFMQKNIFHCFYLAQIFLNIFHQFMRLRKNSPFSLADSIHTNFHSADCKFRSFNYQVRDDNGEARRSFLIRFRFSWTQN